MSDSNFNDLFEVLGYDPETGLFTWLPNTKMGGRGRGQIAGTLCNGYIHICYKRKFYYAHRLAWLFVHGHLPIGVIDHINGNKSDNRISNLRDVTQSQNLQNLIKGQRGNKILGVSWLKSRSKWRARIKADGRQITLGYFDDPSEAKKAYLSAKEKFHIHQPKKEI